MAVVELSKQQIFDLIRQMPPQEKRELLFLLAQEEDRERRQAFVEEQLRRVSAERGLDWDRMSEDEREQFIDDLVHEDRPCGR